MDSFIKESRDFLTTLESYSYFTRSQEIKQVLESDWEVSMEDTSTTLGPHIKSIANVALGSKSTLKNKDFKFMESIVLYSGMLRLDIFKNEPKKAKVEICKGIMRLYGSIKQHTVDPEVLGEISKNPTIMKLADTVGESLKNTDIDPEEMLKAIVSGGKLDPKYQKFVDSLESQIKDLKLDGKEIGQIMSLLG